MWRMAVHFSLKQGNVNLLVWRNWQWERAEMGGGKRGQAREKGIEQTKERERREGKR